MPGSSSGRPIPKMTERDKKRFWLRVDKSPGQGPGGTCWQWHGKLSSKGYGLLYIKKRTYSAHRISYFLHKDENISGLCVLHDCDNPLCANPEHLFVGDHFDNMKDKVNRNRQYRPVGCANVKAKLTEQDVRDIRSKYVPGQYTQTKLSSEYGVACSTITSIINHTTWKHVE